MKYSIVLLAICATAMAMPATTQGAADESLSPFIKDYLGQVDLV